MSGYSSTFSLLQAIHLSLDEYLPTEAASDGEGEERGKCGGSSDEILYGQNCSAYFLAVIRAKLD